MISKHMIHHDNNGDVVLIYNRLDVAAVKTYTEHLRRRLGQYPHWSTVMKLHDAIRWGSRVANESLSSTYRVGFTTIHTTLPYKTLHHP